MVFELRMYQALIAQMQQHMKWNFVSLDKVKAAKTMQKAVSEKMNSILTAISVKDKFITIPGRRRAIRKSQLQSLWDHFSRHHTGAVMSSCSRALAQHLARLN